MMPRLLLVTKKLGESCLGGRELLLRFNRDCLRDIFGENLFVVELESTPVRTPGAVIAAMNGHIDGVSRASLIAILKVVQENRITQIFIDGSNMGEVAAALRTQVGPVKITTFFHNVEARFFLGLLRTSWTPRALLVLIANYLAERKAVKHSDVIIALSGVDSRGLERTYGRGASLISPLALKDQMTPAHDVDGDIGSRAYVLFVGSAFYANKAGIVWFVENVVPRIDCETVVVGRGMEALKPDLERPGKVRVIGGVNSLAQWYFGAKLVIAPIFDGSGMKTKVAEALMFGKKVAGTPEAFSGYEDIAARAGWICGNSDDFVATINSLGEASLPSFDPDVRALYEERYSYPAARARYAQAFGGQ